MIKISHHYRLQALLGIKERAKEKAEQALARALVRLKGEKEKLERLKEEKREIIRRRREARMELHRTVASGKARVKDGSSRVNFLRRMEEEEKEKDKEIENQKGVVADSEKQVERARRDFFQAVRELRIMEKHKELWERRLNLELSRKEEREMDELGNIIHQLRKVA